jgi:hypothetical protein
MFRRAIHAAKSVILASRNQEDLLRNTHDFLLDLKWSTTARELTNPLNRFSARFFSQGDEDGITLEIIRRIGLKTGTFLELGVGDGLENNTLVLLSVGWRGAWIGGETLAFDPQINPKRLYYKQAWVTLDNIKELAQGCLKELSSPDVDVLSVDLDGNDLYFYRCVTDAGSAKPSHCRIQREVSARCAMDCPL